MKTNKKWGWGLISALAIMALAGCASNRHEAEGGYASNTQYNGACGGCYGQQSYGYQYRALPNNPSAPGAPYEWQHVSPRPQMEP